MSVRWWKSKIVLAVVAASTIAVPVSPAGGVSGSEMAAGSGPVPDLVWRLNEAGGRRAADSAGGADGSYVGGPNLGVGALAPAGGKAVELDGVNDYVALPDARPLNLAMTRKRSVSLWFRPYDITGRQVIYEEGGLARGMSIYVLGGRLYAGAWNLANDASADTPWTQHFISTEVKRGETYHTALVLDQPAGELRLYVNGSLAGTKAAGTLFGHRADAGIGGMNQGTRFQDRAETGSGRTFAGVIDDVAIFNDVLSRGDVHTLFTSGLGSSASRQPTRAMIITAGDIANCSTGNDTKTAQLISAIIAGTDLPVTVVPAGDLAYEDGTRTEFNNCYDPTWGRHKALTKPVPGNHEYNTPDAKPYYDYFGAAAAPPQGYYRYQVAGWDVYALNSACGGIGGCGAGSDQVKWLHSRLADSGAKCTLAFMHHPRFVTDTPWANVEQFWKELDAAGADVVVSGHAHYYAESALEDWRGNADPKGLRQFIVGTGGRGLHQLPAKPHKNQKVVDNRNYGVLVLELYQGGYDWEFRRVGDGKVMHSGSQTCN